VLIISPHHLGFATVAAVLLGTLLLVPAPASAQSCSQNADCAAGNSCIVRFDFIILKWRECRPTASWAFAGLAVARTPIAPRRISA
jgi:hypothetical protein